MCGEVLQVTVLQDIQVNVDSTWEQALKIFASS